MLRNIRIIFFASACLILTSAIGQKNDINTFNENDVRGVLESLSSNELKGRQAFSAEIKNAANLIAGSFSGSGLKAFEKNGSFLQTFKMFKATVRDNSKATIGSQTIPYSDVICQTSESSLSINPSSGYEIIRIKEGENAMAAFRNLRGKKQPMLVLMHASHEPLFKRIKQNTGARMEGEPNVIYVLTSDPSSETYSLELLLDVQTLELSNVVGIIPGKTKPEEYVIFSAHYDHIGIGQKDEKGDSIYNGANDDASGTTAVMMLAKHFAQQGNNERTLVFAAFTAEEVGGFGSQYFSKQFDPEKVTAMFNIEMIGTDSKWGLNSAYITGYDKSNMGEILQKNLTGSPFQFYPDPYPQQNLFYRSDNATLARLGVPAHTISTSKMDIEPHYHKPSDEVSTLDLKNMTEIIKAIAISSASIISGKDTPGRVDASQLRR
jgi:hypothetical protein